jgi:hypothetical protein
LNENVDLSASAFVYGDDIGSILQYSEDSIMICGWKYKTALILSIPSMQKTKSFSINTGPNANKYMPLVSAHLVPDTDNRFMLEFNESKFIFLRTIETGAR